MDEYGSRHLVDIHNIHFNSKAKKRNETKQKKLFKIHLDTLDGWIRLQYFELTFMACIFEPYIFLK